MSADDGYNESPRGARSQAASSSIRILCAELKNRGGIVICGPVESLSGVNNLQPRPKRSIGAAIWFPKAINLPPTSLLIRCRRTAQD